MLVRGAAFLSRRTRSVRSLSALADHYNPANIPTGQVSPDWSPSPGSHVDEYYLLPPPNVTGKLHMGHALTITIQDASVRFARLNGKKVRWIFGTDHAGIATQSVVEKRLLKTLGRRRDQFRREEFVAEVWKWTNDHKREIKRQLIELGASLDYNNEYFTLDEFHSKAVSEAFVRLSEKGFLKRSLRMVNWCPHLKTALSDLEVESTTIEKPTEIILPSQEKLTVGIADDFAYTLAEGNKEIVVRTTRLETMLGDVAIAVHPDDSRYKDLIGKYAIHPFDGRQIPIVADSILVDMTLGTGAVKITPQHDINDFECSQRLGLPLGANIFTDGGLIRSGVGGDEFAGLTRIRARDLIRTRLQQLGLHRGQAENPMALHRCSRSGDIIETILKWQWYVDGKVLADGARKAVENQHMRIFPSDQRQIWNMWLDNAQDWCVSRQLWWGHRIPAYRVPSSGEAGWVVARSEQDARRLLNIPENLALEQDDDVLDTWFSSALLPISVFGWPGSDIKGKQLSWMETGSDILFFWVARMVMMCSQMTGGNLPFPSVHLHSMVRDKRGRKMSKSLGNVIDPGDVIKGVSLEQMVKSLESGNLDKSELSRAIQDVKDHFGKTNGIPAFGSDALRLALASYPAGIPQVLFDMDRVVQARLFCNKLWQACKFAQKKAAEANANPQQGIESSSPSLHVAWLYSRLSSMVSSTTRGYQNMDVEEASRAVRQFVWNDLCDVFLETCKLGLSPAAEREALMLALRVVLVSLNPIAPDVSEELWRHLFPGEVMTWNLNCVPSLDDELIRNMDVALDLVRAVRALKLRSSQQSTIVCKVVSGRHIDESILEIARRLSKASKLEYLQTENLATFQSGIVEPITVAPGLVILQDLDGRAQEKLRERLLMEKLRLEKKLQLLESSCLAEQARLDNVNFVSSAPKTVVDKTIDKVNKLRAEINSVKMALSTLGNSMGDNMG